MSRKPGRIADHFTAEELEELVRGLRVATFFDHLDMTPRQQALAQRVDDLVHADMAGELPAPPAGTAAGDGVLAAAMRTAIAETGSAGIDLFPDGFEISCVDDDSLNRSDRVMSRAELAAFLGIPEADVNASSR
ncbi:hypothetical protein ACH5AL_24520 [Actinacidiphila glaucinigra]|uniref:hypothetical protein n=1 Tax=Actinacidiphila glaucinigra TaxID=235986 RepID=UPI003799E700